MSRQPVHILVACMALAALSPAVRADDFWGTWEPANDPAQLGKKVVDDLLSRGFDARYIQRGGISYPEICCAYGCLRFCGEVGDKDRLAKLIKRYDVFFTPDGARYITRPNNVDNSVFGILPMEIYRQDESAGGKWLELGLGHAKAQWAPAPATRPAETASQKEATDQGLTWQTRYWIDDMFMITALQTEAYRVTHERQYLDRAAKEMVVYLDRLQKPNGLFFHHEMSPFFWGRGNGWMAAGMAEILSELPPDHPQRPAILAGYKKMMEGLLKYQNAEPGKEIWNQLIDKEHSWPETSGSGMFTFAMATGVHNGWLDAATYKEPTRKAWLALSTYLNPDGQIREVCVGTNRGTSEEYYENRERKVGDFHGQAAFIWAAWAMARPVPQQPAAAH
jgi:rhamnogalacturonyl hydrolase YesR